MSFTKNAGVIVDGPNAAGDYCDWEMTYNLPPGGIAGFGPVPTGLPFVRKLTSLVNVGTQGSVPIVPTNPGPAVTFPVGGGDQVQLATDPGPGDVMGVFQGPFVGSLVAAQLQGGVQSLGPIASPLTAPVTTVRVLLRQTRVGLVLCGVPAGGTAFARGNTAIVGTTWPFAVSGARVFGTQIGLVMEYPINTSVFSAVSAGIGVTIPMSSSLPIATGVVGMTTAIPITIGSGATQETVTPTTVTQGVFASQTITVAGTPGVNTISVTIGGGSSPFPAITVSVNVTAGNTATTAAAALVAAINASALTLGFAPFVQLATNAAGVVTVVGIAQTPAASYNLIPITTTVTGAGGFTSTAGAATFAGGVNPSVVATIAFAHAAGEPVQGINTGTASLIVAPSVGYLAALLPVDINV